LSPLEKSTANTMPAINAKQLASSLKRMEVSTGGLRNSVYN